MSQQPENRENRNDPDLVQAFLKKWWVESDFKKCLNQVRVIPLCNSCKPLICIFYISVDAYIAVNLTFEHLSLEMFAT
jgi:hypothetical protein